MGDEASLPIKLGPCSNGEFRPRPLTGVQREAIRRSLQLAERTARRRGMDRRRFLQTVCGAATTLFVLNACSAEESASRGEEPGGTYRVPETATEDDDVARDVLAGEELVFDVQTHLLDPDILRDGGVFFAGGYPQALTCEEDDERDCFSMMHYLEELFVRSDTSMAVISAIPIAGAANALPIGFMEETRRAVDRLCGDGRILVHGLTLPQLETPAANAAGMQALDAEHDLGAWKTYTHVPGRGWWLDDRDPGLPRVGEALLREVAASSTPILCVHKGLNLGVPGETVSPADVGPAAAAHPDVALVVYHSGYDTEAAEVPYEPSTAHVGTNRLVQSLLDAGVGPGANVYAELGGTWWFLMSRPTEAAHLLGKLLRYVGEDNVLWGTDSIWFGSPQDQIQAFRAFEISERLQEEHGYPALTDDVKAKILGANAARLYGVDPVSVPCEVPRSELEELRAALAPPRTYGPATVGELRAHLASHGAL